MKCLNCKREIEDNSLFCNWCGKKQIKEAVKTDVYIPEPRKLPSGKYFIQLRINGQSISVTEDTPAHCKAKALAIKSGIVGNRKNPGNITLRQAVDKYIERKNAVLSPATIRGYRAIQRARFQRIMDMPIQKLTKDRLQRAVNDEAKLCNAKTVKNAFGLISSVLYEATGERVNVTLPQVIKHERPFLTPEQIPVFLEAIKDSAIEVPCLLGLWSCRRSEIFALTWQDINLSARQMFIRAATVMNEYNQFVRKDTTKNSSSARIIPIAPRLYQLLSSMDNTAGALVAMHPHTLYKKINQLCAAHGLPLIGIHGLRHSFASLGYHLNIPKKILMEIGGWADDATMNKIYTHIAKSDVKRYENDMLKFYEKMK